MTRSWDSKFSQSLHLRWVLAIGILALLLLVDASLIAQAIRQIESDAAAINNSGKQRMLLERSSVIARLLIKTTGQPEEEENLRQLLIRAADIMKENRVLLLGKIKERGFLKTPVSETLSRLYFEDPIHLEKNIYDYIENLRNLAASAPNSLNEQNIYFLNMIDLVKKGNLILGLETLERELQDLSNVRIRNLMRAGQVLLGMNLFIILIIALFIFRPMARRVEEKTRSLESANRMLEKHAEDLDRSRLSAMSLMREAEDARQAAEHAQERLQLVIDSAPNAILMADESGAIVLANPMAEILTGVKQNELMNVRILELFPEISRSQIHGRIQDCLKTERALVCMDENLYITRKDGGFVFVEVRFSPMRTKEGRFILASIVDMTERKKAEKLRASEERFRGVIEQAGEALFLCDDSGHLAEVNQRACESLGYSRDELLMMNMENIDIAFDRESFRTHFDRLKQVKFLTLERVFQKKDLTTLPVEIHAGMIELHGRQYLLSFARDITERKKAENDLREMSLALANAVEGISRYDEEGKCVMANKSFLDMFGFAWAEFQGKPLVVTVFRDDIKDYENIHQSMLKTGKGEVEIRAVRKDGSLFNNQLVMIKTYDEKNRFTGFFCFMKDITERKYKESLDIKSELISTVAHELRTPLHSVREGISVMLEGLTGEINEEQTDVLMTTKASVDRLARLVNSVLDFQRLEAGILEFQLAENDINLITEEAVKTTEPLILGKGLNLEVLYLENPPRIICDRDRIIQVLVNLINNAVKFTSEGGVVIRLSREKERIKVAIEDSGIGIKADDVPKLFRKFGQLESGKIAAPGGTGLGLVISRRIVRDHGGELVVQSTYNEGSVFSFTLPIAVK